MADSALRRFILSIPLFELVPPSQLRDILGLLRPVTFAPGQLLFREGEPGQAMWVLGHGVEVAISTTPRSGGPPVVVAHAREGETIGEMALVDEGPRSATATVVKGGPTHQIDAIDFRVLRDGFNPAAYNVLRKICIDLCARLRATSDRIAPPAPSQLVSTPLPGKPIPPAVLDQHPPFRDLPQVVKLALAHKLQLVETSGPATVFDEGEHGDAAYIVLSGEVTVGRGGKTLATLGPGAMFGMVAVIDAGGRSASCSTTGPARLVRLNDDDFDVLFQSGNRFAYELVNMVARQLVEHLRAANALLGPPGQATARPAAQPAEPGSRPEFLPMDLELDV